LSKTREESSHHLEIKTIRAIEDDTLNGQSFSQIFCGFSLSSSCWSSWCSSH
jgi:hypothetical protein